MYCNYAEKIGYGFDFFHATYMSKFNIPLKPVVAEVESGQRLEKIDEDTSIEAPEQDKMVRDLSKILLELKQRNESLVDGLRRLELKVDSNHAEVVTLIKKETLSENDFSKLNCRKRQRDGGQELKLSSVSVVCLRVNTDVGVCKESSNDSMTLLWYLVDKNMLVSKMLVFIQEQIAYRSGLKTLRPRSPLCYHVCFFVTTECFAERRSKPEGLFFKYITDAHYGGSVKESEKWQHTHVALKFGFNDKFKKEFNEFEIVEAPDLPQQQNGPDCGMYVMRYIDIIGGDDEVSFVQLDVVLLSCFSTAFMEMDVLSGFCMVFGLWGFNRNLVVTKMDYYLQIVKKNAEIHKFVDLCMEDDVVRTLLQKMLEKEASLETFFAFFKESKSGIEGEPSNPSTPKSSKIIKANNFALSD
ncbi:hypothetical protein ACH5RR_041257 [Cinchona calisaya]|uniref:Ubiquitin-like protease family profile domain-containing protein n=1 Tax=Cinchona calisaya TaxID=153742 RepID=A0ABD2XX24_9GENT